MFLERIFFTSNQKFYNLFDVLAVQIRKVSSLFLSNITNGGDQIRRNVNEMEEIEAQTEEHIHTLFMELGRNLVTPYDREDIHFLATGLRNIVRNFLHITRQIRNYDIDCASGGVTITIAGHIEKATGMFAVILTKLRYMKELMRLAEVCSDMHVILYECDILLDSTVASMLEAETNEIELVKMMDHYEALHKLLERFSETVNACESIIIKYA